MEIDFFDVGIKLTLGLLAVTIYAVWKVREHLADFNWSKFISHNKPFWLWSVSMLILLLTVVTASPDAAGAIKTFIGLDVGGEPASFLSLGWALALIANGAVKKKLNRKSDEDAG